ncbi:hypothetical protein RCL_jg27530.t1 [Rhizophagus clarus]|uniref:Uncharacterized protein n=1 Tax=Rhizophagus clarus TaxID=94130 RepID=A0A8H3LSG5_9GLOM|nr:hypothetical protein RCL_jg27530.t1 [Rhizophagus clarus]
MRSIDINYLVLEKPSEVYFKENETIGELSKKEKADYYEQGSYERYENLGNIKRAFSNSISEPSSRDKFGCLEGSSNGRAITQNPSICFYISTKRKIGLPFKGTSSSIFSVNEEMRLSKSAEDVISELPYSPMARHFLLRTLSSKKNFENDRQNKLFSRIQDHPVLEGFCSSHIYFTYLKIIDDSE